jgi:hypothetical protein
VFAIYIDTICSDKNIINEAFYVKKYKTIKRGDI